MDFLNQVWHYLFLYRGIDWIIAAAVLVSVFLLGDKKKIGFIFGMLSSAFGIIFSLQIKSVANGLVSFILLILYLRGYIKWMLSKNK